MKKIATFEKVSKEQFVSDAMNALNIQNAEYLGELYNMIDLPKRSTKHSAGHDIRTPIAFMLKPGDTIKIPTGIRCKIDDGYVLMVYVRSSVGFKHDVVLSNGTGIIDSDYYEADNEGHIFIKLINHGKKTFTVGEGEKICQGVFLEYGIADDEEVTTERSGGIGSTGK